MYRQPKSSTSDPRSRIAFSEFEDEVTTDFGKLIRPGPLTRFSADRNSVYADVICEDGRRLRCSRRILEERWPWFATQRQKYAAAVSSSSTHSSPDASDFASPPRPSNSTQNLPRARVRNAQFHLQGQSRLSADLTEHPHLTLVSSTRISTLFRTVPRRTRVPAVHVHARAGHARPERPAGALLAARHVAAVRASPPATACRPSDASGSSSRVSRGNRRGGEHLSMRGSHDPCVEAARVRQRDGR